MIPLLKAGNPLRTAEDRLENVQDQLNRLEQYISALSRMHYDDGLPSEEFNAIINGLHLQVYEISQQVMNN
ncbi:hypothetical protein F4V57_07625 [Acinetobacter qingfengensis]|uniref:Uncharacterized protein n=1 Tax=Acinetobacter qingfengensis TaxID=1262585 RepID=A0A1E7RA60_9GAMM|nr:hypothetical protein [Acinetobacter qingfengensis]KAA8733910.1 hypothetical protein F4V57_07625 [Acinetobacter qingfengensis]OEY96171.1 hypothetical protein BJI46_12395 [Acinetobacter qingfengensis]